MRPRRRELWGACLVGVLSSAGDCPGGGGTRFQYGMPVAGWGEPAVAASIVERTEGDGFSGKSTYTVEFFALNGAAPEPLFETPITPSPSFWQSELIGAVGGQAPFTLARSTSSASPEEAPEVFPLGAGSVVYQKDLGILALDNAKVNRWSRPLPRDEAQCDPPGTPAPPGALDEVALSASPNARFVAAAVTHVTPSCGWQVQTLFLDADGQTYRSEAPILLRRADAPTPHSATPRVAVANDGSILVTITMFGDRSSSPGSLEKPPLETRRWLFPAGKPQTSWADTRVSPVRVVPNGANWTLVGLERNAAGFFDTKLITWSGENGADLASLPMGADMPSQLLPFRGGAVLVGRDVRYLDNQGSMGKRYPFPLRGGLVR